MFHVFLRTLVKVTVASLIVGTVLAHFGVTTQQIMQQAGLSQERLMELAQRGLTWALPNLLLGSLVIVPVWFLFYLFRPPGAPAIDRAAVARRHGCGGNRSGRAAAPRSVIPARRARCQVAAQHRGISPAATRRREPPPRLRSRSCRRH